MTKRAVDKPYNVNCLNRVRGGTGSLLQRIFLADFPLEKTVPVAADSKSSSEFDCIWLSLMLDSEDSMSDF